MKTDYVRLVLTVYYADFDAQQVVKRTRSVHCNTASTACFNHMQLNHYGALVAEVIDERRGHRPHAVFRRDINGNVETIFKRKVKEGM
jgi:hypothetical protein